MKKNVFICFIIATRMEAKPFIDRLRLEKVIDRPFPVYKGGDKILIISGIGKAHAAMAVSYACSVFHPYRVLNLGAAGGTYESLELGGVYGIEKTVEPDRPHLGSKTPYTQFPEMVEGFPKAVLATQDKPVSTVEDFREIAVFADLVDMEGASVIQTCKRFDTKCLLFKFVSDTPEQNGESKVIENIKDYRKSFCEYIIDFVIPAI